VAEELSGEAVSLVAEVKRKADSLPRYVVVPASSVASWRLAGTTVIELEINGFPAGRRSLKRWAKGIDQWFMDLPKRLCESHDIETGQMIRLRLTRGTMALPLELERLLECDERARLAWEAKTPSQRRMLHEFLLAAKRSSTRTRRVKKALGLES